MDQTPGFNCSLVPCSCALFEEYRIPVKCNRRVHGAYGRRNFIQGYYGVLRSQFPAGALGWTGRVYADITRYFTGHKTPSAEEWVAAGQWNTVREYNEVRRRILKRVFKGHQRPLPFCA